MGAPEAVQISPDFGSAVGHAAFAANAEVGFGTGIESPTGSGRTTVLEALAEESVAVSADKSHRSTQMGNGVDAEDD